MNTAGEEEKGSLGRSPIGEKAPPRTGERKARPRAVPGARRTGKPTRRATPRSSGPLIGGRGRTVVALAFAGGAYDTAFQIGVIHALLVQNAEPPDVVVGISAGAINATALAEVFQAGPDRAARVARFNEILEEFRKAPGELASALLPDLYQVEARRPLRPHRAPIHCGDERRQREESMRSCAGLIALANDVLDVRITIGTATRLLRCGLGLRAAAELRPVWKRTLARCREGLRLWWTLATNINRLAPTLWILLLANFGEAKASGGDAGALIFPHRLWRSAKRAFAYATGWSLALATLTIGVVIALLLLAWFAIANSARRPKALFYRYLGRLLSRYELRRSIFDPHPLRERLVRIFDPRYYGKVDLGVVVEQSLSDQDHAPHLPSQKKLLKDYSTGTPSIHVGPVATDVKTGKVDVLPDTMPVVDALLAATSVPPLFPAQSHDGRWYIDAEAVTHQPTPLALNYLRTRLDPDTAAVVVHPVVALPLSQSELGGPRKEYTGLVDLAIRAFHLKRFRDATLDRKMTSIISKSLPQGSKAVFDIEGRRLLKVEVQPIEAEQPLNLNERLLGAARDPERRSLILESVADGCRATLETMIQPAVREVSAREGQGGRNGPLVSVPCRRAVEHHVGPDGLLPGSKETGGPGLPAVCDVCVLFRRRPEATAERVLRVIEPTGPKPGKAPRNANGSNSEPERALRQTLEVPERRWPMPREGELVDRRPIVSLLFSGGVFRGVYLVGVVNALNELGLQPDLVAGSSVGSITAAMAAAIFTQEPALRRRRIGDVAATFMALDRLILTDRLADSVRNLTLRGAETRFSPRQFDHVFRTYDRGRSGSFSRDLRQVLAGLERLSAMSPYQLRRVAEAITDGPPGRAYRQLRDHLQVWLDRSGIGMELLGAEPLELLITHLVLKGLDPSLSDPRATTADIFESKGLKFLSTATNLTRGRLDFPTAFGPRARLLDCLLASSAFPAVFRPRWSWEVLPESVDGDQYIDGGVMDNLPLDEVARFLDLATGERLIAPRPERGGRPVPHLVFTASLEIRTPVLDDQGVQETVDLWPKLGRRAKEFGYNRKVDAYATLQGDIRAIHRKFGAVMDRNQLDLEVVIAKPRWLCSTFGFHPMLGFRRAQQAASIAHGCATTIRRFQDLVEAGHADWFEAWGADRAKLGQSSGGSEGSLHPESNGPGICHFRAGVPCPFYLEGTGSGQDGVGEGQDGTDVPRPSTRKELLSIYELCGRPETHRPREE